MMRSVKMQTAREERGWLEFVLVLGAISAICSGLSFGKIIYVDDDAPPGGDGQSWATAYRFLQDGIAAAQSGDEIRVAQGVYKPDRSSAAPGGSGDREVSFLLETPMSLQGGFAGLGAADSNAWDPKVYKTILSGDLAGDDVEVASARDLLNESTRVENSRHVVVVSGEEPRSSSQGLPEFLIEGVVVTAGRHTSDKGGGLFIRGYSHSTIRHCRFEGNSAVRGGGLAVVNNNQVHVLSSWFSNNTAQFGGGAYCADFPVNLETEFIACKFHGNWAHGNGGGIYCGGARVSIRECLLYENGCESHGGGIESSFGYLGVFDSLLEGNFAAFGGGGIASEIDEFLEVVRVDLKNNRCRGNRGGRDQDGL